MRLVSLSQSNPNLVKSIEVDPSLNGAEQFYISQMIQEIPKGVMACMGSVLAPLNCTDSRSRY